MNIPYIGAEDGRSVTVEEQDLTKVRPGDTVIRWLAGIIRQEQLVVKVDDQFIWTGHSENGWRFWRTSGFEYDPDLHMPDGVICSFLTLPGTEVKRSG